MDPQHPTHPDAHPDDAPGAETSPVVDPRGTDASANENRLDPSDDAANDAVQAAVRTLLMTAPDPGPMPDALSRRIEDSLAMPPAARRGDHELFDELGFGEPGAVVLVDASNDVIVFPGGTQHGDDADHRDDDRVVPLPRRRWPLIGAARPGSPPRHRRCVVANQSHSGDNGLAAIRRRATPAARRVGPRPGELDGVHQGRPHRRCADPHRLPGAGRQRG